MAFVYIVRCNFARSDLEEAWNTWYSGLKLKQMLTKPLFLSGQRFVATGLDLRRRYLALWCIASPQAFTTPEYRSDWGFFEWTPHITDWSRDLYALPDGTDPERLAVDTGGALYLASFEGTPESEAEAAVRQAAPQRPGVLWLSAIGLDRHSPRIGLYRCTDSSWTLPPVAAKGMRETIFTPISTRMKARTGHDPAPSLHATPP